MRTTRSSGARPARPIRRELVCEFCWASRCGETKTKSTQDVAVGHRRCNLQAGKEAEAAAQAAPPVALVNIDFRNTPTWSRAIGTHRCVGGIRSATILAPTQETRENTPVYAISRPASRDGVRPHPSGPEANNNGRTATATRVILDTGNGTLGTHLHATDKPYAPGISKGLPSWWPCSGWTGTTGRLDGVSPALRVVDGLSGQDLGGTHWPRWRRTVCAGEGRRGHQRAATGDDREAGDSERSSR